MDIEKLNQALCLRYKVKEGPGSAAMKNWGSSTGPLGTIVSPSLQESGCRDFPTAALVLPFLGSDISHLWESAMG